MNYKETAKIILKNMGGKENIKGLTHCATRLRFTVKDPNKIEMAYLKESPGVIDVRKSSGQYQVIIGTEVVNVARELNLLGIEVSDINETNKNNDIKFKDKFFDTISGIFTPIIPALTAAGMLKALLVLLSVTNVLTNESQTYQILSFVADSAFYFLPVFVAVSTANKLKTNLYIAGMLGAMLIHPNFIAMVDSGETLKLLGMNVPLVSYAFSVIPSILTVWFMSYVEKFADKISPKSLKFLLRPLLTVLIVLPFTLIVFGPIGSYVGNILAYGADVINTTVPWLMPTLMGALFPLLVLTGMHWSFMPIIVQSYATYNYEAIMGPGSFVSNIAQGAVSIAVGLKTKDSMLKQTSLSAGITALLGITEPALFGITLKFKNALYAVMAGGAIGGLYAGIQGVVRYTSGTPGLASFAVFIGENPMNVVHALISVAIGFIVTFVLTWIFVDPDEGHENIKNNNKFNVLDKTEIKSPVSGEVVNISDVNDEAFAHEIIGKGVAVMPNAGIVYAPFEGEIVALFPTGHAIGIKNAEGIEVLIHIGLDTVKLGGKGFEILIEKNTKVHQGDPLVKFDIDYIKSQGYDLTTPIVITNFNEESSLIITDKECVTKDDDLLVIL